MRRIAWFVAVALASFGGATATSQAAPHLSMPQAIRAVERWGGPGTTLLKCKRFSTSVIGCEFLVSVETAPEEAVEASEWLDTHYRGYLNVTATRHGIEVACPPKP